MNSNSSDAADKDVNRGDRQNLPLNSPLPDTAAQPQLEPLPDSSSHPARRLPGWRLWVPLLLQTALIVAVPAQDAYTFATGRDITLQTAPVDPYDLLRGYYQTLRYDISNQANLEKLPGGKAVFASNTQASFYVVLESPKTTATLQRPEPWKPVRLSREHPTNLSQDQVALQGEYKQGQILYGLETYYMPEDQREAINNDINQIQRQNQRAFVVNVRVDTQGNSVPVSLWVGDRNYRF